MATPPGKKKKKKKKKKKRGKNKRACKHKRKTSRLSNQFDEITANYELRQYI